MCRSIKTLRGAQPAASQEEIEAAALQFVRKVSGYRQPSRANQAAFDDAVTEISAATSRLLDSLVTRSSRSESLTA
ncbi:MAG: DUF2277 domain-containing protein [Actinomycetota bacterium]|nr:DUF2277 domain-containing protein [Actinomycetota bacterium]